MKIDIKNISNNIEPEYSNPTDAGCDIRADFSRISPENPIKAFGNSQFVFGEIPYVILDPGCRALIPTGMFVDIPDGYEIQVRSRSGLTLKSGIQVLNSPGTIDSGYKNEIGVILINHGLDPVVIENGERIAQLVLNKVEHIEWNCVYELDDTNDRGGGFGHTGTR